jgi:hypothetical protein
VDWALATTETAIKITSCPDISNICCVSEYDLFDVGNAMGMTIYGLGKVTSVNG